MNKAYLRHLVEEGKFEITFLYVDKDLRVNRQFNLCRQISENISSFTSRVATNVEKEIKKKNKKQELSPIEVNLIVNDEIIENGDVSCKDIFIEGNKITLKVSNNEFSVIINSPWISALGLPNSIMSNFWVYPNKLDTIYTDRKTSDYKWYKSKDNIEWTVVGNSFVYEPQNTDVDSFLKLSFTPKNRNLEGPMVETVSCVPVQAGPGRCPFELRHEFTKNKCAGDE